MRWHEQNATRDREEQLPGLTDGTTVRTFDAPEALNARFHEVHAKSALNRVPGATKLPFGWTVNPYRGCTHACVYCAGGDTQVLMGDGRTRRLADVRAGDEVFGTVRHGRERRYARTVVRDHWSTLKPAFRTVLADGTELVTSADHRLLAADGGWRFVGGGETPLHVGDGLVGPGGGMVAPRKERAYRLGYLHGVLPVSRRLAPAVQERVASFLAAEQQGALRVVGGRAVVAGGGRDLPGWPPEPSDEWCKGFLAGTYDADGDGATWQLSVTTGDAVERVALGLRRLGFVYRMEHAWTGAPVLRLKGGLGEELRFLQLTDPADGRPDVAGRLVQGDPALRVVAVEPLGRALRLFDITTGTGDFIGDGVVHHNCFARPTHEYLDFDAGKDFDEQIIVKVNAPEVLRAELKRPSWTGEHVALGTNTDPYQWVEKRYGLTRAILEALRDARNPCSVLTKSPLLLRDLDLFLELAAVTEFSACLSIPTLDERAWRATEPHTPHPRKRVEAVARLNAAGIPTGVLVAPLMPGVNDAPEQVEAVVAACREAGATRIGGQALFLRGATKDVFMGWLRHQRPDLVDRYEQWYGAGAWLRPADKQATEARLRELTRRRRAPELAQRFQHRTPEPFGAPTDGRGVARVKRPSVHGPPVTPPGRADGAPERRVPERIAGRQESLF